MGKFIFYIFFSLTSSLLVLNAQALAIKHHGIDWIETLQLSKEQQQQINKLEQSFRLKHQALRQHQETCISQEKINAELEELRTLFFAQMQHILTPEQQQKANQITRNQQRKMQIRYAQSLAQELNMPNEQKRALIEVVQLMNFQYQWPIDIIQRQQSQAELENSMAQLLTDEQRALWGQKLADASSKNWHHYREFNEQKSVQCGRS